MKNNEIIDISWPLDVQSTAYKDKKVISFTTVKTFEKDYVRDSIITLGTHSGTHVDAPAHFLEQGSTSDVIPLQQLIGPCRVLNMTHVNEMITLHDVEQHHLMPDEIILFKTKNSTLGENDPFCYEFVYLEKNAAQFLVEKKIKAVGIDYLGIERNQPDHATHAVLLRNNIPIIEGLRLIGVAPGNYFLCCLPLRVKGLDGAPARAILMSGNRAVERKSV